MKNVLFVFAMAGLLACQAEAENTEKQKLVEKNISEALEVYDLDGELTRIRATPFENLYEVLIGPDLIYMSGDGRFVLRGDLLDIKEQKNLSEEQRTLVRKDILESIPAKDYIEFAPENTKHVLYAFTDVDCSYCRRLHQDVPELNKNGIAVRYLAYPRNGIESHAGDVMQSVWCSEDRQQALTNAKNNRRVEPKQCANPVAEQYELGQKLGVRGTPAIYLEGGQELPGYQPPGNIIKIVNQ